MGKTQPALTCCRTLDMARPVCSQQSLDGQRKPKCRPSQAPRRFRPIQPARPATRPANEIVSYSSCSPNGSPCAPSPRSVKQRQHAEAAVLCARLIPACLSAAARARSHAKLTARLGSIPFSVIRIHASATSSSHSSGPLGYALHRARAYLTMLLSAASVSQSVIAM